MFNLMVFIYLEFNIYKILRNLKDGVKCRNNGQFIVVI